MPLPARGKGKRVAWGARAVRKKTARVTEAYEFAEGGSKVGCTHHPAARDSNCSELLCDRDKMLHGLGGALPPVDGALHQLTPRSLARQQQKQRRQPRLVHAGGVSALERAFQDSIRLVYQLHGLCHGCILRARAEVRFGDQLKSVSTNA